MTPADAIIGTENCSAFPVVRIVPRPAIEALAFIDAFSLRNEYTVLNYHVVSNEDVYWF